MSSSTRDYPDRPIAAVGAIVWKDEDVLLIRRAKPPRAGEWSLPGGAQELGETLEEALKREVLEETGITVTITGLLTALDAIYPDEDGLIRHHYTLIDYTCVWVSGEPRPGSEEKEAAWVSPDRLKSLQMWEKTQKVIADSRAHLRMIQNAKI